MADDITAVHTCEKTALSFVGVDSNIVIIIVSNLVVVLDVNSIKYLILCSKQECQSYSFEMP